MRTRPSSASRLKRSSSAPASASAPRHFAIVGAGMAGVVCARTLVQAGHEVSLFEKAARVGGRMASLQTPFGSLS